MEHKVDIQSIFGEESAANRWKEASGTEQQLDGMCDALENARKVVASRCYGDQTCIDASNALFQQVRAGLDTTRKALATLTLTRQASQEAQQKQSPWVLPALLAGAAVCCILSVSFRLGFLKSFMAVLAAVLVAFALLKALLDIWHLVDLPALVRKVAGIIPVKKLRKWVEKWAGTLPGPAAVEKPGTAAMALDTAAMEDSLTAQLMLIEQNLPMFTEQPQTVVHPGGDELWPLVRTMLQTKYTAGAVFPERVEEELESFLAGNGMSLVEYSAENAQLFTTQTMDETFTIFPAVLKDGKVLERGRAAVAQKEV